ncbi:hypothetical protein J437_LFUL006828 [Ladona fulva]|uniref:Uncharacterized protein n=1 Tax=Ladona fulva TaxID=123851 RepID=A0A8K0P207_LADFU|nr:hypothetical protein J437_LFUL006828 [Ladona fulva]
MALSRIWYLPETSSPSEKWMETRRNREIDDIGNVDDVEIIQQLAVAKNVPFKENAQMEQRLFTLMLMIIALLAVLFILTDAQNVPCTNCIRASNETQQWCCRNWARCC